MGVPKITGPLRKRIFFNGKWYKCIVCFNIHGKTTNFEKQKNDIKVIWIQYENKFSNKPVILGTYGNSFAFS